MTQAQKAVGALLENLRKERADQDGDDAMGAWFLGPMAEGQELLQKLITELLKDASKARSSTFPNDPPWANTESGAYAREGERIEAHLTRMVRRLSEHSIPWHSYRYQGHMNWDVSLPAVAGYFGAMLYNQNNAAAEGGPVTTALELVVAEDLCGLIGYGQESSKPWGHIACGGTVANIEALWSARNLKLYPFALRWVLEQDPDLKKARGLTVQLANGNTKKFLEIGWWELLNLHSEAVLSIPGRLLSEYGFDKDDLDRKLAAMDKVSVQHLGLPRFAKRFEDRFTEGGLGHAIESLAIMAPASVHYSVPKAATLLGLGAGSVVPVRIGGDARMDIEHLRSLLEKRVSSQCPVMVVVAVLGTTQESAVDDLSAIVDMREEMRSKGLEFSIHADAAWGGYFASLLRKPEGSASKSLLESAERALDSESNLWPQVGRGGGALAVKQLEIADEGEDADSAHDGSASHERLVMTAEISLKEYVEEQLRALHEADTVTLDPHKSGFVPYPAGAICYRDGRTPEMIKITAPIVYHDGTAQTVGVFGIEGSTPGAAPAAVYASHSIIRPDQGGIGKVLGRCTFNAKRFYLELATMESRFFEIATLQRLSSNELQKIREERWCELPNRELWELLRDSWEAESLFRRLGPDLNINTFALNPWIRDARGGLTRNDRSDWADDFNRRVFEALSLEFEGDTYPPVILTGSTYEGEAARGPALALRRSLGLSSADVLPMRFLIATMMNPWMSDAEGGRRNMVREVAEQMKAAIEKEVKDFWDQLPGRV